MHALWLVGEAKNYSHKYCAVRLVSIIGVSVWVASYRMRARVLSRGVAFLGPFVCCGPTPWLGVGGLNPFFPKNPVRTDKNGLRELLVNSTKS